MPKMDWISHYLYALSFLNDPLTYKIYKKFNSLSIKFGWGYVVGDLRLDSSKKQFSILLFSIITGRARVPKKILGVQGPKKFWMPWRMTQNWISKKTSLAKYYSEIVGGPWPPSLSLTLLGSLRAALRITK